MSVKKDEWLAECKSYEEFVQSLGADAPAQLSVQLKQLKERLSK